MAQMKKYTYEITIELDNCQNEKVAEKVYDIIYNTISEESVSLYKMGIEHATMELREKRRLV